MSAETFPEFSVPSLPSDFVFGVATAAYQIEGGVAEGGRGQSIWDVFSHTSGTTKNGETGDIACDHYHLWQSDLDLMQELGIPAYRLSLSWARLQPSGSGPLNPEGVQFYRNVIEGCRERNIEPFVTLYHWDLPQVLQDAGGWPQRETAYRFAEYAGLVLEEFKDVVSHWITINEPWCVAFLGHSWGIHAPGLADESLAVQASHHLLLAHGLAVAEFRKQAPEVKVGITNILSVAKPKTQSPEDVHAANTVDARMNKLFLEPIFKGEYGSDVCSEFVDLRSSDQTESGLVRAGDLEIISIPNDFVGINHYHNMVVAHDADAPDGILMEQATPNHQSSWAWPNTPWALKEILLRVNSEYSTLPIYVTENGITLDDVIDSDGRVNDADRIDYLAGYIDAVAQAVDSGVPVRGYFAWSFMDNFEWAEGFSKRFGLVYVDYSSLQRTPKQSAYWFQQFIQNTKKKVKVDESGI